MKTLKMIFSVILLVLLFSVLPSLSIPSKAASFERGTQLNESPSQNLNQDNSVEAQIALDYISEKHDIPVDQLIITHEHTLEYAELGRSFIAFAIYDLNSEQAFKLAVDLKDGSVVDDLNSLQQAVIDQAGYSRHSQPLRRRENLPN